MMPKVSEILQFSPRRTMDIPAALTEFPCRQTCTTWGMVGVDRMIDEGTSLALWNWRSN
jgi:hypothetical protein